MTDIKKIINKLKAGVKVDKTVSKIKTVATKGPVLPQPSGPRVRDMRQEAMDMGSHKASEYFGGTNE